MAENKPGSANMKTFSLGSVIIAEGSVSPKEMVIVLQGNVGVFKNYKLNNEIQVGVIGQGSFHGEMSLFLNRDQAETLVALTTVVILTVSRANVHTFFTGQPDLAFRIVESICSRLYEASHTLDRLQAGKTCAPSAASALFPEGHGSYTLSALNNSSEFLYTAKTTCPICAHTFDNLTVLQSRLRLDKTDPDLRPRYKDFEPLYYEMITCPNCFLSVSSGAFAGVSKRAADKVNQRVGRYKLEIGIKTGLERDAFSVFAGFYLGLLCASAAFADHQLITSVLWLKISRLYRDCGDEKMYIYASQKALEEYSYVYERIPIPEKQAQQICYLIGDLYLRLEDIDTARNFFHLAKANKEGTPVMKRQADLRLEQIREIKQREMQKPLT